MRAAKGVTPSTPTAPAPAQKRMLNRREAAEYIGQAVSTLAAQAVRGGGPPFAKLGKSVRYRIADLDAYIEARMRNRESAE